MVNFKKLTDKAKDVVDKRGGMDSLKEDAEELRSIAKGKGSLKDKATAAGKAVKDPGAKGPDQPGEHRAEHARGKEHGHRGVQAQPPGERPEADEPGTRSK
jgi:hypothetical protein